VWQSVANVQPDAGKFLCPTCAARDGRKEEGDGARAEAPSVRQGGPQIDAWYFSKKIEIL